MIELAALFLAVSPPAEAGEPARAAVERAEPAEADRRRGPRRAGDPVTLDRGFFIARDAGGVGREPVIHAAAQRRIIITHEPSSRSAGAEAARRGLGRVSD